MNVAVQLCALAELFCSDSSVINMKVARLQTLLLDQVFLGVS